MVVISFLICSRYKRASYIAIRRADCGRLAVNSRITGSFKRPYGTAIASWKPHCACLNLYLVASSQPISGHTSKIVQGAMSRGTFPVGLLEQVKAIGGGQGVVAMASGWGVGRGKLIVNDVLGVTC